MEPGFRACLVGKKYIFENNNFLKYKEMSFLVEIRKINSISDISKFFVSFNSNPLSFPVLNPHTLTPQLI